MSEERFISNLKLVLFIIIIIAIALAVVHWDDISSWLSGIFADSLDSQIEQILR